MMKATMKQRMELKKENEVPHEICFILFLFKLKNKNQFFKVKSDDNRYFYERMDFFNLFVHFAYVSLYYPYDKIYLYLIDLIICKTKI